MPDRRDAQARISETSGRHSSPILRSIALAALALVLLSGRSPTQEAEPLQPGEGFLTSFSGTKVETQGDRSMRVIDVGGTVGSIVDLRVPGEEPRGQRWPDGPQRGAVTAADVGQVFGIAIDDGTPASIYLTATSAFGLHRGADHTGWMAGMWGGEGGPGTVYRLNAENGYAPEVFAEITLDGRANSGPALGNIAFDPWNRQLFVSDLETGMIHRLALADGADLGYYDHGIDGRASFTDAATGESASLPLVAFDAETQAQTADCPAGDFAQHPECWNYADFRRRVWGLAVRRDAASGEVRLFYALWSSQGFGNPAFDAADRDETRNSVWSVRIDEAGGFDVADVRREFFLPDFFVEEADIARAGRSHPVADLAFPKTAEQNVMLLAERGGVRNLGLDAEAPFAYPHEARVLRYEIDAAGVWQQAGRYDVGFHDRVKLGQPYVRANAAGGVDTGPGYGEDGQADENLRSAFVWMTGDALCSPEGPCVDPASGRRDDRSEVHGLQGLPGDMVEAVAPSEALMPYPAEGMPYPPEGPGNAFMIDADGELARNDATKTGDIEVYQPYPAEALAEAEAPAEAEMPVGVGGADWGVPDYAAEAPWWPEQPAGAGAGEGTQGFDLAMQKTVPAQCQPGGPCDSVIVVTNTGTLPFTAPITVVDELANDWALVGWGPAGSQWNCQQVGTMLTCTHPAPDLMPGEAGAVNVALQVPAGQVPGEWQNCAVLDFGTGFGDANPANDQGCATLQFGPAAPAGGGFVEGPTDQSDLAIEKAADSAECAPGQPCSFTVAISNFGQVKYDGALRFVDAMPVGWSFGNASQGWWCLLTAGGGPLFSCWRDLALDTGQSEDLTVTLTPPADAQAGQVENCAEIDWSQSAKDANPANDRACAAVSLPPGVAGAPPGEPTGFGMVIGPQGVGYELAIDKGAPQAGLAAAPGAGAIHVCAALQPCPFGVTITNMGVDKFDGPFRFTDEAPPGWSFASAGAGWSCAPAGSSNFSCSGDVSLDPGQSVSPELSLNPMAGVPLQPVQAENCVEIDWSQGKKDGNSGNDRSCAPVIFAASAPGLPGVGVAVPVQVEGPDVTVTKELVSGCEPGGECTFNITIRGAQDQPLKDKFKVDDLLPDGWTFAGGGKLNLWKCTLQNNIWTTCNYDIAKNPGMPAEGLTKNDAVLTDIRIRPRPDAPEGTYKNCVSITFEAPPTGEIRRETKFICSEFSLAYRSRLTIEKRFDQSTCVVGAPCPYSIIVKNEGKGEYKGILTIRDRFESGPPYERDGINAGEIDCRGILGQPTGAFTQEQAKQGEFLCVTDKPFAPGTTKVIAVDGRFAASGNGNSAENCSTLEMQRSDPAKLSDDEKISLVKQLLRHKGYTVSTAAGLSADDGLALSRYKKETGFKNAKGETDTSSTITDDFLKTMLPNHDDYTFEHGQSAAEIEGILTACAKVSLGQPGLIISKKGLPAEDFRVPGVRVGTPEAETCGLDHACPFTITVTGNSDTPYTEPIVIEDSSPNGWWGLVSYAGEGWSCTGTTKVVCTHPPANLTKGKSLELKLVMKPGTTFYQAAYPQKHPWIYNCAKVRYKSVAEYQLQNREEYESCYKLRLIGSDMTDWDYVAAGTGSCMPPNCSFYEFTATLKARRQERPSSPSATPDYDASGTGNCLPPNCAPGAPAAAETLRYQGSLSMRITPPPGSSFPLARVIKSAPSCPASAWSCTKTGAEFGGVFACRIDDCALAPEEQVAVRIEGNVAADLKEPPEVAQTREVCGELEYQPTSQPGSIEQKVGLERRKACVTTMILPKPRAVDLELSTVPQGQCAVGQTCRVQNSLGNVGQGSFADAIDLQGQVSPAVTVTAVTPLPAGWSCRMLGGGRYSCAKGPSAFAPGAAVQLQFTLAIPPGFTQTQLTHAVQIAWPPGKGDANPANDSAAFSIPVAAYGRLRAYDLALTKSATGACKPGEACRFRLRVLNQGEEAFEGTISIVDSLSREGVSLRGTAGGLSCQSAGATLNCLAPKQVLRPGAQAIFLIDTLLPRVTRSATLRNCAEITTPGAINVDKPSRADIRALQVALNQAGYDAGPADGVIGSRTRRAIAAARTAFGLSAGDRIDSELVAGLFGGAAGRDVNPANDSDCVTIELPAPPAPPPPPPPAPLVCTGGKVQVGNRCVCPRGTVEVRGICVRPAPVPKPAPPPPPPAPAPLVCTGGKVQVGNRCVCPPGTIDLRGLCIGLPPPPPPPPPPPVKVIPPPTIRVIPPAPPPPPPPACTGGRISVRGLCVCPSDRPVWTGSQCIPRLQIVPMQVCPPGEFWNEPTKECIKRLQ